MQRHELFLSARQFVCTLFLIMLVSCFSLTVFYGGRQPQSAKGKTFAEIKFQFAWISFVCVRPSETFAPVWLWWCSAALVCVPLVSVCVCVCRCFIALPVNVSLVYRYAWLRRLRPASFVLRLQATATRTCQLFAVCICIYSRICVSGQSSRIHVYACVCVCVEQKYSRWWRLLMVSRWMHELRFRIK